MNPRLFGLVIVAPIVQLTLLGYAATTDVRDIPIVVADGDRSRASRELIHRFDAARNFTVIDTVNNVNEIEPYLESGRAWLAIVIPSGFGSDIGSGRRPDGADSCRWDGCKFDDGRPGVCDGVDRRVRRWQVQAGLPTSSARKPASGRAGRSIGGIDPRIRVWFNPQLESRHFMIPGVLALVLLVVTANLAAMAIVREKEVGTLEQLNVTPLRRWELIVGKLLPYGLIGMVDVLLVVAVAVFWFEVPLRGSFALLLVLSMIYVLCTLGLGLFVSTISDTQQQAMMTAMFFFLMPMIYLSGFIFPIENMPAVIQAVTYVIPLRYFLVIVRGIFLKGVGMEVLWPQVAALGAWGIVVISLAVHAESEDAGVRSSAAAGIRDDRRRPRPLPDDVLQLELRGARVDLGDVLRQQLLRLAFEAGELLLLLLEHLLHAPRRRAVPFDRPHLQRREPRVEPRAATFGEDVVGHFRLRIVQPVLERVDLLDECVGCLQQRRDIWFGLSRRRALWPVPRAAPSRTAANSTSPVSREMPSRTRSANASCASRSACGTVPRGSAIHLQRRRLRCGRRRSSEPCRCRHRTRTAQRGRRCRSSPRGSSWRLPT